MKSMRRLPAAAVFLCALAACTLPRGAAMQSEILKNSEAEAPQFAHYAVDSKLLPEVQHWPASKAAVSRQWLSGGIGRTGQVLSAGDAVQIAVWENGENKLMTNAGSPTTQLQTTQISSAGAIFLPYAGPVKIAGLTPDEAREKIQTKVSELIPSAQVQLESTPGKSNAISLVGGVARPGNVPLTDRSLTVLNVLSEGGGVLPSIVNPQLRLLRGGKVYETSMQRVLDDPALDAGVRPGDKIVVEPDRRSFLALGAAGREQVVKFPQDHVSALEAVTLVGGIDGARANPKGVLVLREYPASAVHADGKGGPAQQRVVFSIDLTTTDGLFSAQNFEIQPNDLVLATESALVNVRTVLGLFNASLNTARTAQKVEAN